MRMGSSQHTSTGRVRPLFIGAAVVAVLLLAAGGAFIVRANSTPAYRNPVVDLSSETGFSWWVVRRPEISL